MPTVLFQLVLSAVKESKAETVERQGDNMVKLFVLLLKSFLGISAHQLDAALYANSPFHVMYFPCNDGDGEL